MTAAGIARQQEREGKESINLKIKLQVKLCAAVSKSPASASQRRRVDVYTRERISEYTHAHTRDRTQDAVVARADNKRSENGNGPWLTQSQPVKKRVKVRNKGSNIKKKLILSLKQS